MLFGLIKKYEKYKNLKWKFMKIIEWCDEFDKLKNDLIDKTRKLPFYFLS